LIKTCKHEPINELLGLIHWLKKEKTISKRRRPRALPVLPVSGMLSSLIKSCKHKSIQHLLSLIQWLKNEKKTQVVLTQDNAGTGSALGLRVH
jgi:hypothetical protein